MVYLLFEPEKFPEYAISLSALYMYTDSLVILFCVCLHESLVYEEPTVIILTPYSGRCES